MRCDAMRNDAGSAGGRMRKPKTKQTGRNGDADMPGRMEDQVGGGYEKEEGRAAPW